MATYLDIERLESKMATYLDMERLESKMATYLDIERLESNRITVGIFNLQTQSENIMHEMMHI